MTRNITVGISDELIERMDTLTDVNWSAVTRNCIENYIKQRSAEGLESAIAVMKEKQSAEFASGYEVVKHIKRYSLGELEEFSKAFWNEKHLEKLAKDGEIDSQEEYDELSEKYKVDYDRMKKIVYSKDPDYEEHPYLLSNEFIRGMMEAVRELFSKTS